MIDFRNFLVCELFNKIEDKFNKKFSNEILSEFTTLETKITRKIDGYARFLYKKAYNEEQ